MMRRRLIILAASLCLAAGAAAAQEPQRTTATYVDWTVRCETNASKQRSCEMAQAVHIRGQAQAISQIAVGKAPGSETLTIVFQVPINVWLPEGVRLVYGDKNAAVSASFKRCLPGSCFADVELNGAAVKAMRSRTEQGRLEFKDAAQRDIAMPVSFNGFAKALDAMTKE